MEKEFLHIVLLLIAGWAAAGLGYEICGIIYMLWHDGICKKKIKDFLEKRRK